jgi:hypothetical protein
VPSSDIALLAQLSTAAGITLRCAHFSVGQRRCTGTQGQLFVPYVRTHAAEGSCPVQIWHCWRSCQQLQVLRSGVYNRGKGQNPKARGKGMAALNLGLDTENWQQRCSQVRAQKQRSVQVWMPYSDCGMRLDTTGC